MVTQDMYIISIGQREDDVTPWLLHSVFFLVPRMWKVNLFDVQIDTFSMFGSKGEKEGEEANK